MATFPAVISSTITSTMSCSDANPRCDVEKGHSYQTTCQCYRQVKPNGPSTLASAPDTGWFYATRDPHEPVEHPASPAGHNCPLMFRAGSKPRGSPSDPSEDHRNG